MAIVRMNFYDRLALFANRPNECWDWPGYTVDGYGHTRITIAPHVYKAVYTHRVAYETLVGPVLP